MKHSLLKIISFFIVFCFLLAFAIFAKADFTKVSSNGYPLLNKSTDYSCIYDSNTNLIWENPSTSATYSWYSNQESSDRKGTYNNGKCSYTGKCNTETRLTELNAARLCNRNSWRLPTKDELLTLIVCKDGHDTSDWARGYPCNNYQSNTTGVQVELPELFSGIGKSDYTINFYSYWASETYSFLPSAAGFVNFSTGASANTYKSNALYVMAVSDWNPLPVDTTPLVCSNLPVWNPDTNTLVIPEFTPNGLVKSIKMQLDLLNNSYNILEYTQ